MKKTNLTSLLSFGLLCICINLKGISQVENPNFSPVSPQAASLVRYGNIPIKHSSGKLDYKVPIYEISDSNFSSPILLNYDYAGLMLDSKPTTAGLGWSLIAGGTIAREVRGIEDSSPRGFYGQNPTYPLIDEYIDGNFLGYGVLNNFANGVYDSEPDVYHLSMGGMNASFKLDRDLNPVSLSPNNYLIDFSWDEIIVKDEYGNEYIFTEKEIAHFNNGEPDNYLNGEGYATSWNISTINLSNGGTISFNYEPHNYNAISFSAAATFNTLSVSDSSGDYFPHSYGEVHKYREVTTKILTSISSSKETINFDYTLYNNVPLYNKITIRNLNNDIIKDYDLLYSNFTKRATLDTVMLNGEELQTYKYYKSTYIPKYPVDYSDIDILKSQDYWGYWNGTNSNYLVKARYGGGTSDNSKDLSVNSEYSMRGALTEVHYKSGGLTKIAYESNKQKSSVDALRTLPKSTQIFSMTLSNIHGVNWETKTHTITFSDTVKTFAKINHSLQVTYVSGEGKIEMKKLDLDDSDDCLPGMTYTSAEEYLYSQQTVNEIPKVCLVLPQIWDTGDGTDGENYFIEDGTKNFVEITPGTYQFTIEGKKTSGHIYMEFISLPATGFIDEDIGGIRVKEINNYNENEVTDSSIPVNRIVYDYQNDDGFSSGKYLNSPIKDYHLINYWFRRPAVHPSCLHVYSSIAYIARYSSLNSVNLSDANIVAYTSVKKMNNPNTQNILVEDVNNGGFGDGIIEEPYYFIYNSVHTPVNGFTKYEYRSIAEPNETEANLPFPPRNQYDWRHNLLSEKDYSNSSTLLKTIENHYVSKGNYINQLPQNYPIGLKVKRRIVFKGECQIYPQDSVYVNNLFFKELYNEIKQERLLVKTESFEPNSLISTQKYSYDPITYLKNLTRIYKSENFKQVASKTTYPLDHQEDDYIENLITSNRIAEPIKVETYISDQNGENQELLSIQKTEYDNFNGKILPKFVKTLKGGQASSINLENRIIYHDYDTHHNPIDVSQADGMRTSYIWGYNGQYPVAKIENRAYSAIPSSLRTAVVDATNATPYSEANLITALDNLRSELSGAMVYTYTYKPLVGVQTITDPRGYTIEYMYDEFNRLKYVKDQAGNILSKNEYYYKN